MKNLNFILLVLISSACFANDIDKLHTNEDVYKFLVKKVSGKFKNYSPLEDNSTIIDTLKYARNNFYKIDIDNNGLTDLIIYGFRNFLIVLDNGKEDYIVRNIDGGAFLSNTATLISIDTFSMPKKIIIQQSENLKSNSTL